MPRIRPLRTKEEIAAVPADKSVTIMLEPEGTVILDKEADDEALQAQENANKAKAAPPTPPEDDASTDLRKQLEDMRRANDEQQRRFNDEVTARRLAEERVREREQEIAQSKIRAEDAEYDAILNAIGAAEGEAEGAQRDIALAAENSDAKAVADASRRLARAESRLLQLNDGKEAIERAKTAAAAKAKEPPPKTNQPAPTVEEYIDRLPNLMQSQRDWLKAHPDSLTDSRKNMKLQAAHVDAEDQGLRPGSKEYFQFIEGRLGYKAAPKEDDMDEDDNRAPQVSAPPSRAATNPGTGRPTNTRITLTPEQREIARMSGIDEITYARNLQKMNELKANGQLQ